ncbi:MAG: alpha/beta hydrolase-fold protein, partial [Planctomycetota bacterium]|nr:alpha/beta hydrolase-fold protein [Planctomycetota bacterium]
TPPSFADDRVFVRNLEQLAAVRIVEGNQTSHAGRSDIGGELIRLTERIREVPPAQRMQIVDTFVDARRTWPWVEDDGWVHFLFRGSVGDLAVSGNFTADFGEEVALQRIAGTDLFVRSFRLDPTAHYEYRFHADFGGPMPDPLNPHRIDSNFGIGSELRMPGWNAPVDLGASSPPERRGRFEDLEFDDGAAGSLAGTKLYLPAGYETSGERYPLVVVQQSDGGDSARIEHIFDHEIGETAAPIVAVFLPPLKHAQDLETFKHHADRIVDALIPFLDEHYRLCGGSANRLFVGTGSGAPVAVFTAFARPRVFGKLAAQSFFLGGLFGKLGAGAFSIAPQLQDRIMALVAQATEPPPELYLEWSAHESRDPASDLDALRDTRRLLAVLKQNGFAYRTHEVRGAPGYGSWRAQYGQILGTFFPRFTKCSAEP